MSWTTWDFAPLVLVGAAIALLLFPGRVPSAAAPRAQRHTFSRLDDRRKIVP